MSFRTVYKEFSLTWKIQKSKLMARGRIASTEFLRFFLPAAGLCSVNPSQMSPIYYFLKMSLFELGELS
jgi:hypothetical protein